MEDLSGGQTLVGGCPPETNEYSFYIQKIITLTLNLILIPTESVKFKYHGK